MNNLVASLDPALAPAPLDFEEWLKGLRGAARPPDLSSALQVLVSDPTLDYATHTEHNEFLINNIALLNVDKGDGVFYDIELPRCSDVVADLKSIDPRVSLSIRIGNAKYEATNSFLMVASQYACMHVRMSFSLSDVTTQGGLERVGFSYTALEFQNQHRVKLAAGNVFAGPVLYVNGIPRPTVFLRK